MRVRSIPPRAARRPRGRWQAAASAASLVSESIASWTSVPVSAWVPALAGDSLRLCAADLDREDLAVGRAPVAGARTAQQRHRARLGERVRELEVVRLTRAVRPQAAVGLVLAGLRRQAAPGGILLVALHVDLREHDVRARRDR